MSKISKIREIWNKDKAIGSKKNKIKEYADIYHNFSIK